nr:n-acetylglucosaminyl-phosphatidylinositol biosynthetic protein gpi1 [Quercus suber]
MTTRKHGMLRVFWPSDAPRDTFPGVLVGWRNSDLDVLVVGVLQGVDALRTQILFRGSPQHIDRILDRCGGKPLQVLGTLNTTANVGAFDSKLLSLQTIPRSDLPRLDCLKDTDLSLQVVSFHRPDPKKMQYLSLMPISLALGDKTGVTGSASPFDRIDKEEDAERKRKDKLMEKVRLHTVIRHPRTLKELALPTILNQINCSAEVNDLMQRNIGLVGVRSKRSLSVSERVVESATNLWDFVLLWLKQAFLQNVWPVVSQIFIWCLMAHRGVAEVMLVLLDWRLLPDSAAIKDISATAQQVDIRLQQFCYWPAQYVTLHRRRGDWESIASNHPEYIRFFNSLWLVANDIIIGIAVGSYILENADTVAAQMDNIVNTYSIEGLQHMITWLMGWPAGLKLNNELAQFLGDLFLWVIDYWNGCMMQLRPALPHIVRFIGISSFAGASLSISMFSDLVSILTLHIYSFYIASARIYNWQLTIIMSLFHLFRGKKRNVLRNRIDSCDYDLDQLLLGTILFTLLFFLLPTVAVFYATFAGARIAIIALKAALDTWLACLNHFPLFALMLRIKDSRRLPGGVQFELQDTPSVLVSATPASSPAPTSYIKLKLGTRIRKHYLLPRVFLCLVSGQFIPPIHRKNLYSLQYSMLPIQRVSIGEMWNLLTTGSKDNAESNGHIGAPSSAGHGTMHSKGKYGRGGRDKDRDRGPDQGYWWSK